MKVTFFWNVMPCGLVDTLKKFLPHSYTRSWR